MIGSLIDEARAEWEATRERITPLLGTLSSDDIATLRRSSEEGYTYEAEGSDAPHGWEYYRDLAYVACDVLRRCLAIESIVESGYYLHSRVADPEGEGIESDVIALIDSHG